MKFSKFAEQFDPGSGILQLMQDLGDAVNSDRELQMLGGGNPAAIPDMQAIFRHEMQRLMADCDRFERMVGNYDTPGGNERFRTALADLLEDQFGWPVGPGNIAITNGSQASFGLLFNLFAGRYADGKHRRILLPLTPEYIGYEDVGLGPEPIFTANRPVIEDIDDLLFKYRVDFDSVDIGDDIGAVCVSRPTNPTGNVVTDTELARLSELSRDAGKPLILDGAYGLPFPGIVFTDAQPVWDSHIILCLSLSKLGLPGVRTGIVIASEEIISMATGFNAIFNLAPGRFGPTLVHRLVESKELLELGHHVVGPYYRRRAGETVAEVRELMADLPVRVHKAEGAIFLWLWFPGLPVSSEVLYQRLKARGVLVIAGQHFFPGLEQPWAHKHECIRVTYAADPAQVTRGLEIIADEVRRAYAAGSQRASAC